MDELTDEQSKRNLEELTEKFLGKKRGTSEIQERGDERITRKFIENEIRQENKQDRQNRKRFSKSEKGSLREEIREMEAMERFEERQKKRGLKKYKDWKNKFYNKPLMNNPNRLRKLFNSNNGRPITFRNKRTGQQVVIKPKINYSSDNIFEKQLAYEKYQYDEKEKSRQRNTYPIDYVLRLNAMRRQEMDNQHNFANAQSILKAHTKNLSSKENTIFDTTRTKNILKIEDDNNIMKTNSNSINLNQLTPDTPEILNAPNLFSQQKSQENNILRQKQNLQFGYVELRRDRQNIPKNTSKPKKFKKVSFW